MLKRSKDASLTRRLLFWTVLFGLFVTCDLALFGWLIFRSLSQREINRVVLEARTEAEELARQIAGGVEERGLDLYTAVATESETQTYIDSVLSQREIVDKVEIFDSEGRVVFRSERTETQDPEGDVESEISPEASLEIRNFRSDTPYQRVEVPVGNVGTFVIGIRQEELEERLQILRADLISQAGLIAALTLGLFLSGYLLIWRFFRRARKLEEQADDAERMAYVGTLASGLAHEIRSPLNSLNLNMQMLEEEFSERGGTTSGRRLTAITRSEISRLERLVTDFLSYARPRNMDFEEVAAIELLIHAAEVLHAKVRARGVELDIGDESEGAKVLVDREQMNQLLLNLTENSLDAVREQTRPRIVLAAARESDQVVLSVTDNGVGIPLEEQERMFDVFFSKRKGGTGLGLAIVERIARFHDGDLRVESTPGEGTTISLLLPCASGHRRFSLENTGRFLRPRGEGKSVEPKTVGS